MDGPKVFLSSTGLDLSEYRDAILKAIAETEWFRCVAQENFGIAPAYPRDICRDRVERCELFVAVVGHYRGSEIDGDNKCRSFTEFEYDTAIATDKPRFVAVQPDDHPRVQARYVSRGEFGDRQDAFRRRVMRDSVVGLRFGSADRVAGQVVNALWKHFAVQRALASASQPDKDSPEKVAEFAQALGEIADDEVIDLEGLAKGTAAFDRDRVIADLTRRGEELAAEADTAARPKRHAAARHFRHIGAIVGLGDPSRALAAYARATELDPSDTHSMFWQGWLLMERGSLADAERLLRQVMARDNDPTAQWAANWARLGLGNIAVARGNLPEALKSFRDSLAIADRLAQADPDNAGWQRDVAVSNERIGDMHAREGRSDDAIAAFERALTAYERLLERNPEDVPSRVFSVVPLWRIGTLRGQSGRGELEKALAILKPLAAADRLDANRRGWIATI